MKPTRFWLQLVLALIVVFAILAGVQNMVGRERAIVSARATELCTVETLEPALVEAGAGLYAVHCAECHGENLQGDPAWQTPLADGSRRPLPLDNASYAWRSSDSALLRTIREGRNLGMLSEMPAFNAKLGEAEIRSLLEYLKSNWGDSQRIQQQQSG